MTSFKPFYSSTQIISKIWEFSAILKASHKRQQKTASKFDSQSWNIFLADEKRCESKHLDFWELFPSMFCFFSDVFVKNTSWSNALSFITDLQKGTRMPPTLVQNLPTRSCKNTRTGSKHLPGKKYLLFWIDANKIK